MKKEGLVKKTAENHKKSGTFDFKTVLADAGKEWKDIKAGKHSEYVQGKSSPSTRKNKKSSSPSSSSKKTKSNSPTVDVPLLTWMDSLTSSMSGA